MPATSFTGWVIDVLRITILGCGSSGGVPRPGSGWGACDPANPRNRRRRCAILIERIGKGGVTSIIVDTGPDLRAQLIDSRVEHLDGVIITHEHADHTHGIDDLRPLVLHMGRVIDIYMEPVTERVMRQRFSYIFETPEGSGYPPIARAVQIRPGAELTISGNGGDLKILPFLVRHAEIDALALRIDNVVYMPDVSEIPQDMEHHVAGLDLWIIDALRYRRHPTHFSLAEALAWIGKAEPRQAVLTNLHTDLDYDTLLREIPPHVRPAHDTMVIEVDAGMARFL